MNTRCCLAFLSTVLLASAAHAQSAEFLFQIGTGVRGSAPGEFDTAVDVAVDSQNRIFVADNRNDRIQVFDESGARLFEFGTSGTGPGQIRQASEVSIDALDRVFVSDNLNARIQVFDVLGGFDFAFGGGRFDAAAGLGTDFDGAGRIFVADQRAHRIEVFDPDGVFQFDFGTFGSGNGELGAPRSVAVDSADRIIVAERFNSRVQIFDSAGNYVSQFGTFGSNPGEFDWPRGVAVDRQDNILVTDHGPTLGQERVQVFAPDGAFLAAFGNPGSAPIEFGAAAGLTVDRLGRVLVTDNNNFRVQVLVFDTDGDGIQDPVDDDIANPSALFSDFSYGGSSFGRILDDGGGDVVVKGETDPTELLRVIVSGNAAPALVSACDVDIRYISGEGGVTNILCTSLQLEVVEGPVEILPGNAVVSAPTGAIVQVTEGEAGTFTIDNQSPPGTPPVVIEQDGTVIEIAPGESFASLLEVAIDIRPWVEHNLINPMSHRKVPVVVFGSHDLDVRDVDPETLAFGPGGAPVAHGPYLFDRNRDGFDDLWASFRIQETGIAFGETEACLVGETFDGRGFQGCDAVLTAACGLGFELVAILPPLLWLYRRREPRGRVRFRD